jgi:hypothetical protein
MRSQPAPPTTSCCRASAAVVANHDEGLGTLPHYRAGTIVAWLLGLAVVGFVIWVFYVLFATYLGSGSVCGQAVLFSGPKAFQGGGQISVGSVLAAAVVGGSLWLAAGVTAWKLRRQLARLVLGFGVLYLVGLLVLWEVSPLVWGPRHC